MAYTIPYTDQANKGTITIEDSTLNQDTSLKLQAEIQQHTEVLLQKIFYTYWKILQVLLNLLHLLKDSYGMTLHQA